MAELTGVMEDARTAAEGRRERFLEGLARRVGVQAGAQAVFAQPVERGELTVIPVAKMRWGFGGGTGRGPDDASGEGGGGGVVASPLGFIEVRPGGAVFRRIEDPVAYWPLVLVGSLAAWILLRGVRGLVRR
ncbi:MAG: sporulation protein [Chloroflexota bacterium]|nr:sporulation protein [Chloroflexota bacterium]